MSIKDYIYIALLALLGIAFWRVYTNGENKILDQNKAVVQAKIIHDQEVDRLVDVKLRTAIEGFMCKPQKGSTGSVPSNGNPVSSDVPAQSGEDSSGMFDPSVPVIRAAREADAQLKLAQDVLQACIDAKRCVLVK